MSFLGLFTFTAVYLPWVSSSILLPFTFECQQPSTAKLLSYMILRAIPLLWKFLFQLFSHFLRTHTNYDFQVLLAFSILVGVNPLGDLLVSSLFFLKFKLLCWGKNDRTVLFNSQDNVFKKKILKIITKKMENRIISKKKKRKTGFPFLKFDNFNHLI